MQVTDAQPLSATAIVRLDEPSEVIVAVFLVGAGAASQAGTVSDHEPACPPMAPMEEALDEGVFVIRHAAVVLKLNYTIDDRAGLAACAPLCC